MGIGTEVSFLEIALSLYHLSFLRINNRGENEAGFEAVNVSSLVTDV